MLDGERLRESRKDHGDTQESLGKKLGYATPTVSKWEQGETEPGLETLKQICRMYEVSADYLLGLSDDDPLLAKKRREILSEKSKDHIHLERFSNYFYHAVIVFLQFLARNLLD